MLEFYIIKTDKDLEEMKNRLKRECLDKEPLLACDIESDGLDIKTLQLEGIGIGNSDIQYFIPFPNELTEGKVAQVLGEVFEGVDIIFHNAKFDLKAFKKFGIPWPEKIQDTLIMAWMNDENGQHGLKVLAKSILGREATKWENLNRQADLFTTPEEIMRDLAEYCCWDIKNTFDLYKHFLPLLVEEGVINSYNKIEIKLVKVLAEMEYRGVKINKEWFLQKKKECEERLKIIENKIKELAEDPNLNIGSPVQLETLLFDKFKYPAIKTTPAGKRSTDNEVLEFIAKKMELGEDEFVPLLLKHRDLNKLYTTYLLGLLEDGGDDGIIHTTFLQHGTRTGRLSSNTPNLQNIPARHDEWDIRLGFVPREGYTFIVADYSQIELRMLAHFSKDEKMVEVFNNDGDIHAKTMELTGTDRKTAKGINFGLIYGMGPRTLSHNLEIPEEDAKTYIDRFFAGYPSVRDFIRGVQNYTLNVGYVTMITGRRRRFHEFRDNKWFNTIQRQAINTKIQGSAADLIKVAMIKLHYALKPYDAHQLIQVHDEIVIEVPNDNLEKVKEVVTEIMDTALVLRVPLKIGMGSGDHWIKD